MDTENNKDILLDVLNNTYEQLLIDLPVIVKGFRKEKKLSQEQFAQNLGLCRKTISRLEIEHKYSLKTIILIKLIYPDFLLDSIFEKYHNKFEKVLEEKMKSNTKNQEVL